MNVVEIVSAARKASVPAIAISTADQAATAERIKTHALPEDTPCVRWDCVRGFWFTEEADRLAAAGVAGQTLDPHDPALALGAARALIAGAALIVYSAHRFMESVSFVQAISNLRDAYKADYRLLILLGASFALPAELVQDVLVFDEPLPVDSIYVGIAEEIIESANQGREEAGKPAIPAMSKVESGLVSAALRGMTPFAAEQALAMSLTPAGFDVAELWARKKTAVEASSGLEFEFDADVKVDSVIGLDAIVACGTRMFNGPCRPDAVLFIDEIEKHVGGGDDTSGVSQGQRGTILTWTQERRHPGFLVIGPPGTGKSMLARALGATARVPTVTLDIRGTQGSLVGESERNLRNALRVLDGIARPGRLLMVATCNKLASLPPELRRRFSSGTWFVDAPSVEAQKRMWTLYTSLPKYGGHDFGPAPSDTDLTGSDIANIVQAAWAQQISLKEAALIATVPVLRSNPGEVNALREAANGVLLSAHIAGVYRKDQPVQATKSETRRKVVA